MQIVIDIDEYDYNNLMLYKNHPIGLHWLEQKVIAGTPLPKGHGRLIDVKQIVTEDECIWNSDGSCTTITTYDIDSTPTIIEADKAERREKT